RRRRAGRAEPEHRNRSVLESRDTHHGLNLALFGRNENRAHHPDFMLRNPSPAARAFALASTSPSGRGEVQAALFTSPRWGEVAQRSYAGEGEKPSQSEHALAQLQRRQSDQRQNDRDDPEAHHDSALLPPLLLIVMVQGRHSEHTLARELERRHL